MSYISPFGRAPVPPTWWQAKAPDEVLTWSETITPYVNSTDIIAQVLTDIAPNGPSELAMAAIGVSGQTISLTLINGQPRRDYVVRFRVSMTNGSYYEPTLGINIRPLQPMDQPQTVPVSGFGLPAIWPPYYSGLIANDSAVAVVDTAGWPTIPGAPGSVWLNGNLVAITLGATSVLAQPLFMGLLRSSDLLAIGATPLPLFDPQVAGQLWQNGSLIGISVGSQTGLAANGVVLTVTDTTGWPTSPTSLPAGALWLNGVWVNVVPGATYAGIAPVFLGFMTSAELLAYGGAILPVTDPRVAGQLWINGVVVNISSGA